MGDSAPNLPRPGTPPSRPKRGHNTIEMSHVENTSPESPVMVTPAPASDRRQRRRRTSSSTTSASPSTTHERGILTSPFPGESSSRHGYESFLVYLPNGTSVDVRVDAAILRSLTTKMFSELVQTYYEQQRQSSMEEQQQQPRREVQWGKDVHIEDFEGNVVEDGDFVTLRDENKAGRGLLLYDNHPDTVHSHPGFWNVTPVAHVLDTLPQDYTVFSALADEVDNSLQAVYQLQPGKTRLICVDLDHKNGKIAIFDTGKGMDSTPENSISKWGTLGASMNRHERSEAIGGPPPYLKPSFGMYGFGGIGAGFHLGGSITVSSKTEASQRVAVLHLKKNILKTTTTDGRVWRTAGEFRSPTPEELELSPHGSFTKVEISDLKGIIPTWKVTDVRRKLKDYYFPYIQNDEGIGGTTSTPVHIRVNGVNLAEVLGGEVAHSNYYSSIGDPYVLILKFKKNKPSTDDPTPEANARITCRYFPSTEGREAIQEILDKLAEEDPDHMELNMEKFPRRSIRRLGRLLPDSQNEKLLPFMEPKRTLNPSALNKHCYKRAKAFIDVDAGFTPNQTKMDLLTTDIFSTALLNLGKGDQSRGPGKLTSSEPAGLVTVLIQGGVDGEVMEEKNIHIDYEKWISKQHGKYDTGLPSGESDAQSDALIVTSERHKKELLITDDVFHVLYSIKCRAGSGYIDWDVGKGKPPLRLKLQKGMPGLNNNDMVLYVTVECFISEGFSEAPGEARIICRPMGVPEERGSKEINEPGQNFDFILGESRAFPIEDILFSNKYETVTEDVWLKKLEKMQEKLPGFVELLNDLEALKLVGQESIPKHSTRTAGSALPTDIIAVVRPNLCKRREKAARDREGTTTRLEQKFVISEAMDIKLVVRETKYHPQKVSIPKRAIMEEAHQIFETKASASRDSKPKGLYRFSTTALERITKKSGTYFFIFSLVSVKHQDVHDFIVRMNVAPSCTTGKWNICSHPGDCAQHHKNESPEAIKFRLGRVRPRTLYLSRVDEFGNSMEFEEIPSDMACSIFTVQGNAVTISTIISKESIKITNSKLNLEVPITVGEGNLAPLKPTMQAVLKMTIAGVLVANFSVSVLPGEVSSARIKESSEAPDAHLHPGKIIEHIVFEVLDKCHNPVSAGQRVKVVLKGFAFQDKIGPERSVDGNGCLDLGLRLRLTSGFGESARVELRSCTENLFLFEKTFTVINRSLRVRNVPDHVTAGSQLEGIEVEAVDETGEVDVKMSGKDHILSLDWDRRIIVPLLHGRCTLQGITIPREEGYWEGCVFHTHYPNLRTEIKVKVVKQVKRVSEDDMFKDPVTQPDNPVPDLPVAPPVVNMSADELDYLKLLCQSTVEETLKLEDKILRLNGKLIKQNTELERLQQMQKQHEELRRQYHATLDSLDSKMVATHPVISEGNQTVALYPNMAQTHNEIVVPGCTANQVQMQIANLGHPPGTHAAAMLLQAQRMNHYEAVSEDILGIVALLGAVETEQLNRALVEFLGLENMLAIICRTRRAAEYIGIPGIDRVLEKRPGLCDFVKSHNLEISGRFRVITLTNESSFFKRVDGQPAVDTTHPQKLLNLGPINEQRPKGSLGYAVNMIHLNEQQLHTRISGHHGLRETLFFMLFGFLEVFDTTENMLRAQHHIRTSALSLDGGLIRTGNQFELGLREDPVVWFPTWIPPVSTLAVVPPPQPLQSITPSTSSAGLAVKGNIRDFERLRRVKEAEATWQVTYRWYMNQRVEEKINLVSETIERTKEKICAAEQQLKEYAERFASMPGRKRILDLSLMAEAGNLSSVKSRAGIKCEPEPQYKA